jgi:WD40 repeat protein
MDFKEKNQRHWLDIAEFSCSLVMILALIVGWWLQSFWFPLTLVAIAVLVSQLNRLRSERLERKRASHFSKQLQRLSQMFEALEQAVNRSPLPLSPPFSPSPSSSPPLSADLDRLHSLEDSLSELVKYFQQQAIAERLEQLERRYQWLSVEAETSSTFTPPLEIDSFPSPVAQAVPNGLGVSSSIPAIIPQVRMLRQIPAHRNAVSSLAISEDGRFFVSASWDQSLKIWETDSGNLLGTVIAHSQGVLATVFLAATAKLEDCRLASGSFDQTLKFWRVKSRSQTEYDLELERTLTAHTGSVYQLALAADHQLLLSASYDQTLKQWDSQSGVLRESSLDSLGSIEAIAVHEQREIIAAGGGDGTVTLWQLGTGQKLGHLVGNISSIKALAINHAGHWIAAACTDGTIKFWQLPLTLPPNLSLHPQQQLLAHQGQVTSLCFTGSEQLLSAGNDGGIKLWQPEQGEAIAVLVEPSLFAAPKDIVLSLTLSQDEQFLLSGHADGTVSIWQFFVPNS